MPEWQYLGSSKDSIVIDNTVFDVDKITPESASNFLGHMYNEGMKPGRFTGLIIEASMAADTTNLAVLSQSFPQYTQIARMLKVSGNVGYNWVRDKSLEAVE